MHKQQVFTWKSAVEQRKGPAKLWLKSWENSDASWQGQTWFLLSTLLLPHMHTMRTHPSSSCSSASVLHIVAGKPTYKIMDGHVQVMIRRRRNSYLLVLWSLLQENWTVHRELGEILHVKLFLHIDEQMDAWCSPPHRFQGSCLVLSTCL